MRPTKGCEQRGSEDVPVADSPAGPRDTTLVAAKLRLSGCTHGFDPQASGRALHAGFLTMLREVDSQTATRLHEHEGMKPFTVALVPAGGDARAGSPEKLSPPVVRVTSLDMGLSGLLLDEPAWRGLRLRVRNAEARIEDVTSQSGSALECGVSSFAELAREGTLRAQQGDALSLGMRFLTPTTFRLAETTLMMPLPWPRLVFQSLEQKWNTFAKEGIWLNWVEFEHRVSLARHWLRTAVVDLGTYRQVGFVGDVEFVIHRDASRSLIEALDTLAGFSRFAGIGAKTTMGMGVAIPFAPRGARGSVVHEQGREAGSSPIGEPCASGF